MGNIPEKVYKDSMESMINSQGLYKVLGLLADICQEKADSIDHSYQDLKAVWEKTSRKINDIIKEVKND